MELIEYLVSFGLTRQEATIYLLLFQEGVLNGYEVAKSSGISRSNAYSALAGLVEKGAAYMIEESATKYIPVPVDEFCSNKIRKLTKLSQELKKSMPVRRIPEDGYITIRGEAQIQDKLINMLEEVKERIYLSMAKERLTLLSGKLGDLISRGIKVVIITDPPYGLSGGIIYHANKPLEQIRIIVDSKYVLTGAITDPYSATCLYSSNNNLVEVFKDALSNEIKLLKIKEGNEEDEKSTICNKGTIR